MYLQVKHAFQMILPKETIVSASDYVCDVVNELIKPICVDIANAYETLKGSHTSVTAKFKQIFSHLLAFSLCQNNRMVSILPVQKCFLFARQTSGHTKNGLCVIFVWRWMASFNFL